MPGIRGMDRHTPRGDGLGNKYCGACRTYKPLTEFHARAASPDGRHGYCKACRKEGRSIERRVDPPGHKTCSACGKLKPLDLFYDSPIHSDGRQSQCKECSKYSHARRGYKLKNKYGITSDDYDAMLKSQDGRCAICGTDRPGTKGGRYFVVDHCHDSDAIRGLLCVACNVMLGHAQDSPAILRAAIDYLAAHDGGNT